MFVDLSEIQNASDIESQCFGYDFSDIVSDIRNYFRICYDASPIYLGYLFIFVRVCQIILLHQENRVSANIKQYRQFH